MEARKSKLENRKLKSGEVGSGLAGIAAWAGSDAYYTGNRPKQMKFW
jgi:hypothetical protein